MQRNLVVVKIEIHPGVGAATFGATQHVAIKTTCHIEVGHVECKMKQTAHGVKA